MSRRPSRSRWSMILRPKAKCRPRPVGWLFMARQRSMILPTRRRPRPTSAMDSEDHFRRTAGRGQSRRRAHEATPFRDGARVKLVDDEEMAEAMKERGPARPRPAPIRSMASINQKYLERQQREPVPTTKAESLLEFFRGPRRRAHAPDIGRMGIQAAPDAARQISSAISCRKSSRLRASSSAPKFRGRHIHARDRHHFTNRWSPSRLLRRKSRDGGSRFTRS